MSNGVVVKSAARLRRSGIRVTTVATAAYVLVHGYGVWLNLKDQVEGKCHEIVQDNLPGQVRDMAAIVVDSFGRDPRCG